MSEPWIETNTDAKPVTVEDIQATIEEIKNHPYYRCGTRERPHLVHPKVKGWTFCASCGTPIFR